MLAFIMAKLSHKTIAPLNTSSQSNFSDASFPEFSERSVELNLLTLQSTFDFFKFSSINNKDKRLIQTAATSGVSGAPAVLTAHMEML